MTTCKTKLFGSKKIRSFLFMSIHELFIAFTKIPPLNKKPYFIPF